jgi:hypothetical protein
MNHADRTDIQLSSFVDTSKPRSILADAKRFFRADYPKADFTRVEKAFLLAKRLYDGRYPGYLSCAVAYHDFVHSLSVFAAASRLLDGCELSGTAIGPDRAAETLVAALFHDCGFIREEGDQSGTGAQYTKVHVDRSAAFVRREAGALGLAGESAARAARMIFATDLAKPWGDLRFEDEGEGAGAQALAAADLLGQMADRVYLEKLLFLYYELREAGIEGYGSPFDILRKTAGFYESTKARLDGPLGPVSAKSRDHFSARYGIDEDLYRTAIARQMAHLDAIIADHTGNFRGKLKRLDLAAIEHRRSGVAQSDLPASYSDR